MQTLMNVAVISFVIGYIVGIIVKGQIDKRFNKRVQDVLIDVGQEADDEIEALNIKVKLLENKIKDLERKS